MEIIFITEGIGFSGLENINSHIQLNKARQIDCCRYELLNRNLGYKFQQPRIDIQIATMNREILVKPQILEFLYMKS